MPGLLSGEWINKRVGNVMTQMEGIVDHLFDGLLSSGYLPFEEPVTPELVDKMTQLQFEGMLEATFDPQEKAMLMDMALDSDRTNSV